MKAIVLAAGFSTRLYPITHYFPKGLLPIKGKAIVQYTLDQVVKLPDIDQIALVTNKRYFTLFETWVNTQYKNRGINLLTNGVTAPETRLGAIGDLLFSLEKTKWKDDLLVVASDTLTSLEFPKFLAFFRKQRGVVNAVFDTHNKTIIKGKLGCVKTEGNKITHFVEKPEEPNSTITSIPFYIFPKECLQLIKKYVHHDHATDAPGSLISWLIGSTPVFAFDIGPGYYYDVGTIDVYNKLAESFGKV